MKKEFQYVFAVSRGVVFEVNYYTLGNNSEPFFTTSAGVFNRPRTDYNQCGQCQDDVLKGAAFKFYKKWDKFHLKDLTHEQYEALVRDIDKLKSEYRHYIKTDGSNTRFSDEVAIERAYRGVKLK